MKNLKSFQNPILWSVIIFVIAASFRIFNLNLIEFKYDEAYTVFQLNQFYDHPYLMQVGPPQSTGVYNPPLFNYLMVILSLFSRNPQFLSFLIALINVVFVAIFYLVVRKFYGNFAGVVSGLLLAVSPWNIIFSRKIWIPDLLGPMMVIVFYYLHQVILTKNNKAVLPLFIFLTLIPQMHASGLFFTLTTIIILLILKIKINFKQSLIGFSIGLIPALPYFVRQLTSTPFCIDCVSLITYQGGVRSFEWENFIRSFNFLGGFNFQILLGESYPKFLSQLPISQILPFLYLSEIAMVAISLVWVCGYQRKYIFLVLYLLVLPSLYFLTRTPAYMHYFVVLSPVIILLQGLFFYYLWSQAKAQIIKFLVLGLLTIVLLSNLIFENSFFNFLSQEKVIKGDFGPIYSVTQALIKDQTESYRLLPDYELLESYSFMFAQTKFLHQKMGEYFIQTSWQKPAILEFQKAISENQNDKYSRANLAYLYIQTGEFNAAKNELDLLSTQDATLAAKLKMILENNRKQ